MRAEWLETEEIGGDKYPSLEGAQRAALPDPADLLASLLRQSIEDGTFVVVNGVVRLAQRCESERLVHEGFTNGENVVSSNEKVGSPR